MATECRSWWRNCAIEADGEIQDIDGQEDRLAPLSPETTRIRELISSLEVCHHKAERWVESIIEAIGAGATEKGLGTRPAGHVHPAEVVWQNACAALSAWCAGCPIDAIELTVGSVPATKLLAGLGPRSALKEWQVQRVIDRIRNLIHWPQSENDPTAQYAWLLLNAGEYEATYRSQCPPPYAEHEDFWLATARTVIHDTHAGEKAELSLALAIDMLWPCHWRFVENLRIVLDAVGGNLHPAQPFAACGRNIALAANRKRLEIVARTLHTFCDPAAAEEGVDMELLAQLGKPTDIKKWLTASLAKTIQLQVNPSAEMQALSALEGPAWIRS